MDAGADDESADALSRPSRSSEESSLSSSLSSSTSSKSCSTASREIAADSVHDVPSDRLIVGSALVGPAVGGIGRGVVGILIGHDWTEKTKNNLPYCYRKKWPRRSDGPGCIDNQRGD